MSFSSCILPVFSFSWWIGFGVHQLLVCQEPFCSCLYMPHVAPLSAASLGMGVKIFGEKEKI